MLLLRLIVPCLLSAVYCELTDDPKIITLFWHAVLRDPEIKNLSPECSSILSNVAQDPLSAYSFIDSSAGLPKGLLHGTVSSFGDYDLCVSSTNSKYCLLKYGFNQSRNSDFNQRIRDNLNVFGGLQLEIGVCIPTACSEQDVRNLLDHKKGDTFVLDSSNIECNDKSWNISTVQMLGIVFVLSMMMVVVYYTIFTREQMDLIKIFSLKENAKNLIQTSMNSKREDSIDIFRFWLMILTVAMHSSIGITEYHAIKMGARIKTDVMEGMMSNFWFQPLINIQNVMAGFYILSGLSVVYSTTNSFKNSVSFSIIIELILKRWVRYASITIAAIAVNMIWPLMGSGPMFNDLASHTINNCRDQWWRNLLMINNSDDPRKTCLQQTWFLTTNFQLYILALVSLAIMSSSRKTGTMISLLLIATGMMWPSGKHYKYGFLPTVLAHRTE